MAAHWATGAVHAAPVFGERGALLEHWVFSAFYNWPLTIRRRIRVRAEWRKQLSPRSRQVILWALLGGGLFLLADKVYLHKGLGLPHLLYDLWWLAIVIPVTAGALVTLSAGGTVLGRRIVQGAVCGFLIGLLYAIGHSVIDGWEGIGVLAKYALWRVFVFGIFAAIGAILTELKLPEPRGNMTN